MRRTFDRLFGFGAYKTGEPTRLAVFVSWLLLVPFFFLRISIGEESIDLKLRWPQLALLALLVLLFVRQRISVYFVAFGFFCILVAQIAHALAYQTNSFVAPFVEYQLSFFRVWVFLLVVCLTGVALVHREHLARVFLILCVASVAIGVAALLVKLATGISFLVHSYGDLHRMQAFLSEPSAFAPIVSFLVLCAVRWRRPIIVLAALVGLFFSFSPVVLLSAALAVFLVVVLRPRRHLPLVIAGLVFTAVAVPAFFVADAEAMMDSESGWLVTLGRLLFGLQSVMTAGADGVNDRFAGFLNVVDYMYVESSASFYTGLGFNASAVVFESKLYEVFDHALWITFLFSYGIPGAAAIVFLGVWAAWLLLQRNDAFSLMFVAFFTASLINSAQGFVSYAFVFLGIAVAMKDVVEPVRGSRVPADTRALPQ